ncbi:restriction endonuclease [Aerosakkonema funiforme]|uniref:restriction endonuclease n=1 Tax=Aerosakkonema funiforme TaxID=1246630 RepID=UPI0035BB5237
MAIIKHDFTNKIFSIIERSVGLDAAEILEKSELIQYLNIKTKAANRGSKSRAGLANHYAIYVLIEDYINRGFDKSGNYKDYEGAQFSVLLRRLRELPFGNKLQNHALNHRLNEEFKRYFPSSPYLPILRDVESNRYWINENLLIINLRERMVNIASSVKEIIEAYVQARQQAFSDFMTYCQQMIEIQDEHPQQAVDFIKSLLRPNVDARVFEIVSFSILKEYYADQIIYWGWSLDELNQEYLVLYKTGRTNANDGGIDFVMKPLGRFFQVTETVDAGKYFLDIDKVQRYPITFVVKSQDSVSNILQKIEQQARARYPVESVVRKYLNCVEEVININELITRFDEVLNRGSGERVIREIVLQSRIEFNVEAEGSDVLAFEKAQEQEGHEV